MMENMHVQILYKRRDKKDIKNYRPISLMSHIPMSS